MNKICFSLLIIYFVHIHVSIDKKIFTLDLNTKKFSLSWLKYENDR